MCKSGESGSLGIKNIKTFNVTLLGKWKWRLGLEEKGLWKDILVSKYGSWRTLNSESTNSKESRWWKDLRSVTKEKGGRRNQFNQNYNWRLGKENKILF